MLKAHPPRRFSECPSGCVKDWICRESNELPAHCLHEQADAEAQKGITLLHAREVVIWRILRLEFPRWPCNAVVVNRVVNVLPRPKVFMTAITERADHTRPLKSGATVEPRRAVGQVQLHVQRSVRKGRARKLNHYRVDSCNSMVLILYGSTCNVLCEGRPSSASIR